MACRSLPPPTTSPRAWTCCSRAGERRLGRECARGLHGTAVLPCAGDRAARGLELRDDHAGRESRIEGFTVIAREIPHKGGRTFGYRGERWALHVLTYIPDHCPTTLGSGDDGFGELPPDRNELAKDADVLVHDVRSSFRRSLPAEADFGHSVADYAVELGEPRRSRRSVVLFHRRHTRTDEALDELAQRLSGGSEPEVSVAAEGTILEL